MFLGPSTCDGSKIVNFGSVFLASIYLSSSVLLHIIIYLNWWREAKFDSTPAVSIIRCRAILNHEARLQTCHLAGKAGLLDRAHDFVEILVGRRSLVLRVLAAVPQDVQ